ncbi:hypothetical protein [Oceanobacillus timonensis]|uniref:hypothetical protein n=1 Tax=Oceanobacillus timonensis TaxID=1926285 RepID=UPI0009B96084|nr:hypothetical protein [Oceanobacillus timonensis]
MSMNERHSKKRINMRIKNDNDFTRLIPLKKVSENVYEDDSKIIDDVTFDKAKKQIRKRKQTIIDTVNDEKLEEK